MGQAWEADEWTSISPTNTEQVVRATLDLLSNKKLFMMWEKGVLGKHNQGQNKGGKGECGMSIFNQWIPSFRCTPILNEKTFHWLLTIRSSRL